jgi:hypothetical protein
VLGLEALDDVDNTVVHCLPFVVLT